MIKKTCIVALAFAQMGCSGAQEVPLTTVLQTSHCPIAKAGLSLYRTPEAFARAMNGKKSDTHALKQSLELKTSPGVADSAVSSLSEGNWAVVASLGQQPSAGYSVQLASTVGHIDDKTLTIQLQQSQPREGTMQAAVVTTPCVIVSFAAQDINQIVAKTEDQGWQLSVDE